jgi:hypothetical protein
MRWDAAPDTTSRTAVVVMILHAAAVSIAGVVAWKRRDTASLALMVVGVGAQLLAVLALRALVGPCLYYLLFWVAAGNAVAWLGAVATATDAIATRLRRQNPVALRRTLIAICGIVGMAGAEATTRLQYAWIVHNNAGTPFIRYDIEAAYAVLVDRLRRDHASPVVHFEGAWTSATIVALELFRDGIPTYFLDRDRWVYGRPLSATEAKRPLHIYVRDPFWDLPFAACLESLAATGFVEILVAPASVDGCP